MKIVVLGTGNMGAWFIKELSVENKIAVFDIDGKKTGQFAGKPNVRIMQDLAEIKGFKPELLLNAVTLQKTVEVFQEVEDYISPECIISDIASVKDDIPQYYEGCKNPFVSSHPMFGPTFADLDSLKQENAIIISESDSKGAEFFRNFYSRFNLKIFEYSFEQHDEMMAYSLSLPFVSSLVFAACMKEKVVPGSTFARQHGIAKGLLTEDDRLISEILFNDNTLVQLEKVTSKLEFLKHIIRQKDYEESKFFFDKLRKNIT